MKKRFFFVIYLHDKTLKSYLDCMRLIADSRQKNFSHITVKGPYKTNQQKLLQEDNNEIIGKEVKVIGVGNFFEENQNTIFLKCEESKELYNIWKRKEEKTYSEFHPHITIYDGLDRSYAIQLFKIINNYNINFKFKIDKLELYSTRNKNENDLYNLRSSLEYYKIVSEIANFEIAESNIDSLSMPHRLKIIDKLCQKLEEISHYNRENAYSKIEVNKDDSVFIDV